jgi:hypothetical protein
MLLAALLVAAAPLSDRVVSYRIEAVLDPAAHAVHATETLTWRNRSREAVGDLYLHAYLNAFRDGKSSLLRFRRGGMPADAAGGLDLRALRSGETDLLPALAFVQPDDGNADDATLARAKLPAPVPPGGAVEVRVEFTARLPRVEHAERAGWRGDFHMFGQWHPKPAVLLPGGRFAAHQYLPRAEFFADFAEYDVSITAPARYVIAAPGRAERRRNADGTVTQRFVAEDVHDFAFAAWPGFETFTDRFAEGALPAVEVRYFVPPERLRQRHRYVRAVTKALLQLGSELAPYPWPTLTVVDTPYGAEDAGGMEYPSMIVLAGRLLDPGGRELYVTAAHEMAHQWFHGMIASDEAEEPWLDEGMATLWMGRVLRAAGERVTMNPSARSLPLPAPMAPQEFFALLRARGFAGPALDPIAQPAWRYTGLGSYGSAVYDRAALALMMLEREVGPAAAKRLWKEYVRRFAFRHPRAADFRAVAEEVSGKKLDAFFRTFFEGAGALDYAVDELRSQRLESGEHRSVVRVRRVGDLRRPVTVVVEFEDGTALRESWDGEGAYRRFEYVRASPVARAELYGGDPPELERNTLNDGRRAQRRNGGALRLGSVAWLIAQLVLSLVGGL